MLTSFQEESTKWKLKNTWIMLMPDAWQDKSPNT